LRRLPTQISDRWLGKWDAKVSEDAGRWLGALKLALRDADTRLWRGLEFVGLRGTERWNEKQAGKQKSAGSRHVSGDPFGWR